MKLRLSAQGLTRLLHGHWSQKEKQSKQKLPCWILKSINRAFEELKSGKAAFNKEIEGTVFPVRDVEIVYLETENYQQFLQPVYLFKSDNNLASYVPALDENWIIGNKTD